MSGQPLTAPFGGDMEGDHWPHGSRDGAGRDLTGLRNRVSEFFESLTGAELARETHRHLWVADWLRVADDYRLFAESARRDGSAQVASEAGLCSLTALEVARSLSCPEDPALAGLAGRVGANLKAFMDGFGPAIERVEIDGLDQGPLSGFFVPASRGGPCAPAIICIGDEDITLDSMMSRLLPATRGGTTSLLFLGAGASPGSRGVEPQMLQCWLDYLEARQDVDAQQIAVYGEGTGASRASRLAVSDCRIAAAVCDAGLLTSVARRASVHWMTGVDERASNGALPPSRRIACPLLMVVGGRSMLREREALELQATYRRAGADCSVVVPNRIPHPLGEVENFIAADNFIVQWLDSKFGVARQFDPVTYL